MKRLLPILLATGALLFAACGDDSGSSSATTASGGAATTAAGGAATTAAGGGTATTAAGGAAASTNIQKSGECGLGTGQKATGEPIKIGSINTNVPGIDFTWISSLTKAYFDCVNDNGGINGRPIQYIEEDEHIDPAEIAGLAKKLAEQDNVLGFVGNTSIIDCSVNGKYYADNGFFPIIAGVDQACFTTANFSAVNMGPYYSSLGGAQAALRAGAKGTMVVISPNQPGIDVINSGVTDFAEQNGLKGVSLTEDVPIADPAVLAQKLVQTAGEGGGVVLDFTGPTVVPLLQAIDSAGLIDKVVWASSTPPNDPSVAQALSPAWNGKFLINAEFSTVDSGKPDMNHMIEVHDKYAPSSVPISAFAQMGYLAGRSATEAMLGIKGDITKESINDAFKNLKDFSSDLWCKPWYFDSTVGSNVSNNTDITVTPQDGKMVQTEDCFEIAELPANPLAQIRAKEQELGLNS
jgi:branched-chain amino acid transport system substrate-binding protein